MKMLTYVICVYACNLLPLCSCVFIKIRSTQELVRSACLSIELQFTPGRGEARGSRQNVLEMDTS